MSSRSLLEQLGDQPVPQRPVGFGRQVHDRINGRLTAVQLAEFAVRVLPFAFFHFMTAMIGSVWFSLTGRYPEKGDSHAD